MGIDIIEKNGQQLMEYKLPNFNENQNDVGSTPEDFETLQVLGHGAFSQVLKVKSKKDGGIYALKKVDMSYILEDQELSQKYFENEVLFLKKLNHPNIIKCYNIFQVEQYLYFLMEFMNNGDLESYNDGILSMNVKIPEPKLWEIFYKCLSGLDYIHKSGIIHRDIKLQNLFLDDKFNVKIGDFNISAVIDINAAKKFADNQQQVENLMNTHTTLGSPKYQAPEVGKREYGQKVDVYSMGISFYELCFGHIPKSKKKFDFNDDGFYSKEIKEFIKVMIDEDETKRPTCNEALVYAADFFIKLYVKNTSVESVVNCFSNYIDLQKFFSHNVVINYLLDKNKEISKSFFSAIQTVNDIKQKRINLYELRKALENEGLDAKSDNLEIDPGNILIFFLSKLNSELNEIDPPTKDIPENEKKRRYHILSKKFCFSPGEEEEKFNLILSVYNSKILSIISRNFFSYIKTKRTCIKCGNTRCYFSKFYFIPINLNILKQKFAYNKNVSLIDAINTLKTTSNTLNIKHGIECKECKNISQFNETKNFYHTAKNLIFIFDRGENKQNDYFLNFDENLVLNNSLVERYNEVQYQLIGMITKVNEEYISFIKTNNIWISSKGEQFNFINAQKHGLVIALFYYSETEILSLCSIKNIENNQSQMQNIPPKMNSNNNINPSHLMINNNQQQPQFQPNWNNNPNQISGMQGNQNKQNFFNMPQNINNNNISLNNPQFNGPKIPQFNGSMNPQFIGPKNPQFIGPMNPQFIEPKNPQFIGPVNPQFNGPMNPQINFNEQNMVFRGGNNRNPNFAMNQLFNGNGPNNNFGNPNQPIGPMNQNMRLNPKTIDVLKQMNGVNNQMNNGPHNINGFGININNNFNAQNNQFGNGNNQMNNNMKNFNNVGFL